MNQSSAEVVASIRHFSARIWASPGGATASSVAARALAFFAPVPFLTANFSDEVVALWFVIMTFQAIATALIGTLPTILLHMVSYAQAGAATVSLRKGEGGFNSIGTPNYTLLSQIARALRLIFAASALLWILAASTLGTVVIWRQVTLSGIPTTAVVIWAIFVVGAASRLFLLSYSTFLIGKGHVAPVRRLEAISWASAGLLSTITLAIAPNLILAMAMLQAPFLANLFLLRRMAIAEGWSPAQARNAKSSVNLIVELYPRAWRGSVGVIAANLIAHGSSLIFAQFGQSTEVAAYAFAITIFGLINQLSNSQTDSTLPALSRAYALGEHEKHRELAKRALWRTMSVYIALIPATWIFLQSMVHISRIELPLVPTLLWSFLSISYFILRYSSFHLHYYTITNNIKWHIFQGACAFFYFLIIIIEGAKNAYVFPFAQAVSLLVFPLPYARWLTKSELDFPLRADVPLILAFGILLGIILLLMNILFQ